MNGRSEPYFFAFETKTKPGKVIGHCVRIETVEVDSSGFDHTSFSLLGKDADTDMRIRQMMDCAHSFVENNPHMFPE